MDSYPASDHNDIVKIDPEGDLILEVGANFSTNFDSSVPREKPVSEDDKQKPLRILVSSKILTMSSPVFKCMLRGNFIESQLPLSQTNPPTLSLPEDNPHAMKQLCDGLHNFAEPDFDNDPPKEHLLQLLRELYDTAVVADKYGCSLLVKSAAHSFWVQGILRGKFPAASELGMVLCISYVLDDEEVFYTASRMVYQALGANRILDRDIESNFGDRLPEHVCGKLQSG